MDIRSIKWQVTSGKWVLLLAGLTAALFWMLTSTAPAVDAHGTLIEYESTITVTGRFDHGEAMENAEVSIFSPADPENVWEQGIADADGRYTFSPDISLEGEWTISYRSAGHGDIAYIPIGAVGSGSGAGGPYQQIIMAVAVIWGFIGTALYFQARQTSR